MCARRIVAKGNAASSHTAARRPYWKLGVGAGRRLSEELGTRSFPGGSSTTVVPNPQTPLLMFTWHTRMTPRSWRQQMGQAPGVSAPPMTEIELGTVPAGARARQIKNRRPASDSKVAPPCTTSLKSGCVPFASHSPSSTSNSSRRDHEAAPWVAPPLSLLWPPGPFRLAHDFRLPFGLRPLPNFLGRISGVSSLANSSARTRGEWSPPTPPSNGGRSSHSRAERGAVLGEHEAARGRRGQGFGRMRSSNDTGGRVRNDFGGRGVTSTDARGLTTLDCAWSLSRACEIDGTAH